MKACIHRGTKEIGGTCIEIESEGKRIILDVGLPLALWPSKTLANGLESRWGRQQY